MQQKLESFDELTRGVIDITCTHANIRISELFTSKKKEIVNARSIVAYILRENGQTYQSIADILNVDVKASYGYVMGHDNRMADRGYASLYSRVLKSLESTNEIIGDDVYSMIRTLLVRLEKLESRVNHLTHLITN